MENINNQKTTTAALVVLVTIGWIFAFISLLGYSFIFGVIGVIMGILTTKNGSRAGLSVIVANIILMGIGLVFSEKIADYVINFMNLT
ncbi:hypothetical protein RBH29_08090 [Herbivorax sp. ANBcel31]|uniref:hypothetical protein n=1 Tax=Herbivorax sp. ANBcel31 TaxID=3069754 RepID=UPI0027B35449|nr:hypothetical protein [Herbivorax sp. ANBcel31]MDQ2086388.1 hypothetical protein [Herbivorax sp. ANBcel31]